MIRSNDSHSFSTELVLGIGSVLAETSSRPSCGRIHTAQDSWTKIGVA